MSCFTSCRQGRRRQTQHPCGSHQQCSRGSCCSLSCWLHSFFYFSKKITGCLGCSIGQSCLLPRKQTPASSPPLSPESCAGFTSPLLGPGRSRQREGMARSVPSAQPAPHGTGLCTQHGEGLQGAGTPQQAFWPHYCMFCRRPWAPLSSSWVMMRWKSWPATADIHQQPLLEGLLCCGNAALPATV